MNDFRPGESEKPDELHDERLSELYGATRDVEPPVWLDQRILAAARAAVEKPRLKRTFPWYRRHGFPFWAAPVALAATVVLAVGLLRWLPPASDLSGMPAPVEEKASRSLASPAAELDAAQAKSAGTAAAPPAAPDPAALPPAKPEERPLMRSRTMPVESLRSESPQAAPMLKGAADEEAARVRERLDDRSPAEWRAEIAEVYRQGRKAEAAALQAEFRRRYPDEPLNDGEPPR